MKDNLRQTWNDIKKVLSRTGSRSRFEVKSLIDYKTIHKDGFKICKLLKDFFSSVSSRINESIPSASSARWAHILPLWYSSQHTIWIFINTNYLNWKQDSLFEGEEFSYIYLSKKKF